MPYSSAQIAQMNGAFQQQHMQGMQMSGMIGQGMPSMYGQSQPQGAEGMASGMMSRGVGVGGAMATGGLALAGLDPFSMAFRGGAAAYGAGAGVGGIAAAGVAAAAPMALGLAGASYAGQQMMLGSQQTQQFNDDMRQAFTFRNMAAHTGRGFSQNQLGQIGSTMRNMVGGQSAGVGFGQQQGMGAGGAFVGFEELGRLASNMGRMGMGQGAETAKDFTAQFRKMLQSVKSIAEDLGTSLEEAQTVMASLKGSGIFKGQAGAVGQIRQASLVGGLGTSEVTGMMQIGSQVSRMVGGLGGQGAMAGMKAISQVGTANRLGIINEEDIYNTTGLTGAEGRRALAQQQLQRGGQYLRSQGGRKLLRSLAGEDGGLDQGRVADFMAGTPGSAERGFGPGVTQANFIRNEGRLRGAALEQFGGMLPGMALQNQMQKRGKNPLEMDNDTAMLFAQRQLGMGRDEADTAVKMLNRMPDMMIAGIESKRLDSRMQEKSARQSQMGLKGLKSKFERARDSVNNEMQEAGQKMLNGLTGMVDEWAHELAGTYEEIGAQGVQEAIAGISASGSVGRKARGNLFGGGGLDMRNLGIPGAGLPGGGGADRVGESTWQSDLRSHVRGLRFDAEMGEKSSISSIARDFAETNKSQLIKLYAENIAGLEGQDRIAAMSKAVAKMGGQFGAEFGGMTEGEKAKNIQQMERVIGIKEGGRLADVLRDPGLPSILGGGPRTESMRRLAEGKALRGSGRSENITEDDMASGRAGMLAVGKVAGDFFGSLFGSSGNEKARGAADVFRDKDTRQMALDVLTGKSGANDRINEEIANMRAVKRESGELTGAQSGKLGALLQTQAVAAFRSATEGMDIDEAMKDEAMMSPIRHKLAQAQQAMGRRPGDVSVTNKDILKAEQQTIQAAQKSRQRLINSMGKEMRERGIEDTESFRSGGIGVMQNVMGPPTAEQAGGGSIQEFVLTQSATETLNKYGGDEATQAAQMALDIASESSKLDPMNPSADAMAKISQKSGDLYQSMATMSVKGLRGMARGFAGQGIGATATRMLRRGDQFSAAAKRIKGGRDKKAVGATAELLGLGGVLGDDEISGVAGIKKLNRKTGEYDVFDSGAAAKRIADRLGIKDAGGGASFIAGLAESLEASTGQTGLKGKEAAKAGAALLDQALEAGGKDVRAKVEKAQGKREDPSEKITGEIKLSNTYLNALVQATEGGNAKLAAIITNTQGKGTDGEAGGGGKK